MGHSNKEQIPGSAVTLCQDGKYRWYYEVNMFRNTAILGTLFKIFGGITAAIWLLGNIADGFEDVLATTRMVLIVFGVMTVLILLGYAIVAARYGGKYCVIFEMDEKGVEHKQLPSQFQKAQLTGLFAALVSGNPTTAGAGLLSATHSSLYSNFSTVRSVKPRPRQHLIKVNAPFSKNQIYVNDKDYRFVLDYITTHCPKIHK